MTRNSEKGPYEKTMAITSHNTLQVDEINIKLTPFLERALPLARLGIRVFPCDVRSKEPVMLNSGGRLSPLKHACGFEEAIRQQWGGAEYADCNVGCFFPREAQLNFVVDIDSIAACEKLLGRPLSLTSVAEVQSSTPDKRHVYFSGKVPDWFWAGLLRRTGRDTAAPSFFTGPLTHLFR
jgi:Bifunctional DNA primase/polymerase, N-terminal